MKKYLSNLIFMTRYIVKYKPSFFPMAVVTGILQAAQSVLNVLGLRYILDSIFVGQDIMQFLLVAGIYATVTLLVNTTFTLTSVYFSVAGTQISLGVAQELMRDSLQMDYSCYDNPKAYDMYTRAVSAADSTVSSLFGTYIALFSSGISVVAILGTLYTIGWEYILLAVINVVVSYVVALVKNKWQYQFDMSTTRIGRALWYFKNLFFTKSTAKEIRIFGIAQHFIDKYTRNQQKIITMRRQEQKKQNIPTYIQHLLTFCTLFTTMYLAGKKVIDGVFTIGVFMASMNAVQTLTSQLNGVISQLPNIIKQSRYIDNVRSVIENEDTIENDKGVDKIWLKKKANYDIAFDHVSFAYPDTDLLVLRDVTFSIKSREKVVIVGENGSGKTTLFKLLLRLYDPDSGVITIDGRDIREYDITSLREAFSTVFQDFQFYATTIRENITFTEVDEEGGDRAVARSLDMALLSDKIKQCTQGIHTPYTKQFDENGVLFSVGEVQKMAIARAYYRDTGIMLMDEPSSALDPLAENTLINIILDTVTDKTALIISHRLRICKRFDHVYYLEDGQIIESGSHDELMALQGKYYTMFTVQHDESAQCKVSVKTAVPLNIR